MQLPDELQAAIEALHEHVSSNTLAKAREQLSLTYRSGHDSDSIFNDEAKRLAYLTTRMPATYAAVHAVLKKIGSCTHLLDLGAGPGTASWAAAELFPALQRITLVEQNAKAIALGKQLAAHASHPALQKATWVPTSLLEPLSIPEADVAIFSYVLGELKQSDTLIDRFWKSPISTLAIIEPGTPNGFALIRKIRQQLIDLGAHILAPCPHAFVCPIQGTDWCHFSARVERTRFHRLLKGGTLGYEDEKFSYIIVSKTPGPKYEGRIIRSPAKHSGFVKLTLCTERGTLEPRTVTRSQKELYRPARHAEWGDPWIDTQTP